LQAAVNGTVEQCGGIDVVIANAGVIVPGSVRLTDPEFFERTIDINLLGVYRTIHTALPQLIERQGYALVVSSTSAAMHGAGGAAYSASKAGSEALGNCLRAELDHHSVAVGVAYFGFVDTEMVEGLDRHPASRHLRKEMPSFMAKKHSRSDAAGAIVAGVEHRAAVVAFPPVLLRITLALRGVLGPLALLWSRRGYAEVEAAFERDVAERGAGASAPVGAGGAAVAGARGRHEPPGRTFTGT
jgi:NAD(P)-dependent dehydrogenase (short-subunit alcohol dehydrogenase family)